MKAKINKLSFFSILFSLFAIQCLAQQNITLNNYAGSYYSGHTFAHSLVILETNGRFSTRTGSDDMTMITESGSYTLSDNLLHFNIVTKLLKRRDKDDVNLLDPNEVKQLNNGKDSGEIKREFNMIPIHWSDRIYLIYEEDLMDFVNAINFGFEPRSAMPSEPYYGMFYLRIDDDQKQVSNLPSLPTKWQSYLLTKPVKAKIIDIKVEDNKEIAQIDKGSQDGLKVGMKLLRQWQKPESWSKEGLILTVSETTAKVQIKDSNIGEILSSKYYW